MRIISWNVNGIRAVHKKGLFMPFVQEYDPDILCIQETKAEKSESIIDLFNYGEYWNSAEKKGYSGTAVFTKNRPLTIENGLSNDLEVKYRLKSDTYGNPNTEGRVITLEFKDVYVVNVYTPNAKDDLSRLFLRHTQWDPAFLDHVTGLEKKKPVIFCGDLNVAHTEDDLARPKENEGKKGFTKEEREGIQALIGAGFLDTFRLFIKGNGHYTWWSHFANARARNVGWRIDYIFVSSQLGNKVGKAEILKDVMGSDHCPVLAEISLK